MDYLPLFNDRDRIEQGPFTLVVHRHGGKVSDFIGQSEYLMLFCLEGEVKFTLTSRAVTLEAGQMVVMDNRRMLTCHSLPDTVMLKYSTRGKLAEYMDDCSKTFDTPVLSIIPIHARLAAWLDAFVTKLAADKPNGRPDYPDRRRELAQLLLEYRRSELEELFTPLFACSRQCERTGQCVLDLPPDTQEKGLSAEILWD